MSCITCQEAFSTFNDLKAHCLAKQHGYFLYKCSLCSEAYPRLSDLDEHMVVHDFPVRETIPNEIGVDYTDAPIQQDEATSTHILGPEADRNLPERLPSACSGSKQSSVRFHCAQCPCSFPTSKRLEKHEKQHGPKIYPCLHCDCSFAETKRLEKHMRKHETPIQVRSTTSMKAESQALKNLNSTISGTSTKGSVEGTSAFSTEPAALSHIQRQENAEEVPEEHGTNEFVVQKDTPSQGTASEDWDRLSAGGVSHVSIGSLTPPLSSVPSEAISIVTGLPDEHWEIVSSAPTAESPDSHATPEVPHTPAASPPSSEESQTEHSTQTAVPLPDFFKEILREFFVFACPSCPRTYPTERTLEKHQREKHNHDRAFSAGEHSHQEGQPSTEWIPVEGGFFDTGHALTTLDAAAETVTPSGKFSCQICGKAFDKKKGLISHLDSPAAAHAFFRCTHCRRAFVTLQVLTKHGIKKHSEQRSTANSTSSSNATKQDLPLPQQQTQKASFKCKECGKKTRGEESIKPHKCKPFKCDSCPKTYYTEKFFDIHRMLKHSGTVEILERKKAFPCTICGQEFEKQKALKAHFRSEAKSHSSWKCSLCERVFTSRELLAKHQMKKHKVDPNRPSETNDGVVGAPNPEIRTFTCFVCPSSFLSPSAVAHHLESGRHEHLTRHHITAAVKALDIVPQITVRQITGPVTPPAPIVVHEATSSTWNGSEFQCFLCPKGFASLGGLNSHLNSAAHDEKEFKCPKCSRHFTLISALVQHLESHTCGLAQADEIINFYDRLADGFSNKLLIA
ncbi:hypothetical protein CPC08DRAFT_197492 [Agrocybe pediades]|nr:hypothetical protein CPC08DRAFT_197492 [Agrocybe pediades]